MSNKISNQERENIISSDDLLLISKSLNEYNSAWKSKAINFDDFAESMNREFRNRKFKDVLDTIQEIYNTYLNSSNLSINFDTDKKEFQLVSKDDGVFSKVDVSELIFAGMIKDVTRITKDGIPYIRFEIYIKDGKEVKTIDIPLGDFIDIYTPGNGLCCEEKQFYINEDVVATNVHVYNEISSVSTILNTEINDNYNELTTTISTVSSSLEQTIDDNYNELTSTISSTSSDLNDKIEENYNELTTTISSVSSELNDKIETTKEELIDTISVISSDLNTNITDNYNELTTTISAVSSDIEHDITDNYNELTTTISSTSSDLDDKIDQKYTALTGIISTVSSDLSNEISTNYAKKTELSTYTNGKGLDLNNENVFSVKDEVSATAFSEATSWVNNQNYTTYDNVKNNLSNDGYSMKVIFRDWEEE